MDTLGLVWITLLRTFVYRFLCGSVFRSLKMRQKGAVVETKWGGGGRPMRQHRSFYVALDSSAGKEPACQSRRCKRCRFNPCVGKIPWRRAWQPTPVFLPGKSHRQRNLVGYSPWGQTRLSMHTHRLLDQLKMLLKKNHGHRVGAGKGVSRKPRSWCQSSAPAWSSWA